MCLWICVFVECTYLENIEQNAPQRLEEYSTRLRRAQVSNPADIPKMGALGLESTKETSRSEINYQKFDLPIFRSLRIQGEFIRSVL